MLSRPTLPTLLHALRTRIPMAHAVGLSVAVCLWVSPAVAAPARIAVLELTQSARLTTQETAYLTDLLRGVAVRLPRGAFSVITRENIMALLPPGTDLAACVSECEVETGRNVGADYVVSGSIIPFGTELRLVVKLHATKDGALLASESASGKNVVKLEEPVSQAASRLFRALDSQFGSEEVAGGAARPPNAIAAPALAGAFEPAVARCGGTCGPIAACVPSTSNSELRAGLARGLIPTLLDPGHGGAPGQAWASSMLGAEGREPRAESTPLEPGGCAGDRHAAWTCMYSARSAQDGDPRTAWCEGRNGDGLGEVLVAALATEGAVEIWAGFGKSAVLHDANSRPRRVRVSLLRASVAPDACGVAYQGGRVVGSHEVELADVNGYQILPFPPMDSGGGSLLVAVEVLDVYHGTRYSDTCISEIRGRDR